jgi:sugar phosphate isomerase/epimerase
MTIESHSNMHSPSRRQFSQAMIAGSLLAAAPHLTVHGQSPVANRKMTLALTPGSMGVQVSSQKEIVELAAKYGFESIEPLGEELARATAGQLEELKAAMAAKKLSWAAAGLTVDFRGDEAKFADGMKSLPAIAAGLKRAGAERVGTWLMPTHDQLTYRQNFAQHALRLRAAAKVLKDNGLRLGLEYVGTQSLLTRGKYPFLHTMAETKELISEIGTGNVGFILDTWHWWTAGDTEADILSLKNEDVVSVDLNDAPKGIKRELQQDNQRELPAATGVIDAKVFMNALRQISYDGPVRPEPFNKVLNEMDNDAACAATIAAMKKAFAL